MGEEGIANMAISPCDGKGMVLFVCCRGYKFGEMASLVPEFVLWFCKNRPLCDITLGILANSIPKGTVNMGLWYMKDSGFKLIGFSDADYAGCKYTFKSTFGGAQFLGEKLVSWSSKKQDCTSLSTAEAEYVYLSSCCAQVLWMRTQLTDYRFHFNKILIYCDLKSAIAISCNPVQHSRTKHIVIRYHFIKEHVEKGTIELYFVKTDYQLADLFTKALLVDRFNYLVRRLGMRSLSPQELERLAESQEFFVNIYQKSKI
ncbi:hypothetical protein Tco_0336109 [Tanacetum coccineum]